MKDKGRPSHPGARLLRLSVYASAGITLSALLFLIAYVLVKGIPHLKPSLFALQYNSENVSMLPAIVNTLIVTLLSLVVAVPLGICTAIYLAEYAKHKLEQQG